MDDQEPVTEEDGHYFVVDGRRWRATDPGIPEKLRKELVDELMSARRAVGAARRDRTDHPADKDAEIVARARVQDAKVALGERGEPWWEVGTPGGRHERLTAAMRTLLRHRDPESTICPSDAARVAGGAGWRSLMDEARGAAADLVGSGIVEIRQHGAPVPPGPVTGPIRLARGPSWPVDEATGRQG